MRHPLLKNAFLAVCASTLLFSCAPKATGEFDYLYKDLPFEMPRVTRPVIPAYSVDLTDFGGVGDGVTLNTEAFAQAMKHLSDKGGGHLIVPAGLWLTGPIELLSGCDLHLTDNAVVIFSADRDLYPVINTVFEGLDTRRCESPLHADGAKNISITGTGVFDGNGDAWRMVKKSKMSEGEWNRLLAKGGVLSEDGRNWYPDEGFIKATRISNMNVPPSDLSEADWKEIKSFLRPNLVQIRNSENVLLEGVTFQNSACWNVHPLMCKNLIVKDVNVRNPWYSQNGDAIDVDSCENVLIVDSIFDAGDDGICIKSGKDADGRRRARPCKNLIVDNCTVFHGHGGFTVGSEMSGGVENIKVSNCRFLGTDVGLRFKSTRGRGGVVRNIHIDNVYMKDIVADAILFDLFYSGKDAVMLTEEGYVEVEVPAVPVDETTPEFRDIFINQVYCNGAARAMFFNGLPEMPVSNINITDCTMTADTGIDLRNSQDITFRNVKCFPKSGAPVNTYKVKNFTNE
ncbi:MAG: glycoside hydrolase family 28 protein [Bacteroidales bacterium]|nr:glycoside hydrolase family 28 protein [Bacteroidales bacterium]